MLLISHGCGTTRGVGLEKLRQNGKIKINILSDFIGSVYDSGTWMPFYIEIILKTYAPLKWDIGEMFQMR